jgi:hypothetical protein
MYASTLSLTLVLLLAFVQCSLSQNLETIWDGANQFEKAAKGGNPVSDKVTAHSYQLMYGMFLLPFMEKFRVAKKNFKMMEIGLGCNMDYGPGASVQLWRNLTEGMNAEMWFAEFNAECVGKEKASGRLAGVNIVVGDQANKETLKGWVDATGGNFDVIIDDGGHTNEQIVHSFYALWPTLKAGGFYFIEDIHVGLAEGFLSAGIVPPTVRLMHAFIEVLSIGRWGPAAKEKYNFDQTHHGIKHILAKFPFPEGLEMVACQFEACVLYKAVDPLVGYWG